MKELTEDIVVEAIKLHYESGEEDFSDFLKTLENIRKLGIGQTLVKARNLDEEHVAMRILTPITPGPGILTDVPKPNNRDLRYVHIEDVGARCCVVIDGKFAYLDPKEILLLEAVKGDG